MNLKKIKSIIEKLPMFIATTDKKCKPHVIAVTCVKVIDDKKMLITDNYMKTTRKNLLSNNKVEILVYGKGWKGYRIKGKSEYHKSGKWLEKVKAMKENKTHPAKGAIIITASKIEKVE